MRNVLLVDDEPLILYALTRALEKDGLRVRSVMNGADALREMRRSVYDICFLDVNLPDANGLAVMNVMRQETPRTGIIIMTAQDLGDGKLDELRKNDCLYLPKPFELATVNLLVKRLLQGTMSGGFACFSARRPADRGVRS